MRLKSDSEGFLVGEIVSDIRRTNNLLTGIRADVMAIKSALLGATSGGKGSKNTKIDGGTKIATPTSRRTGDNVAIKAATPARSKGAANVLPPAPRNTVTPNGRDASTGRFAAKGVSAASGISAPNIDDKKSQSLISNLASRITSTAAGAAYGISAPNIDDKKSQSLISNLSSRITSTAAGAAAGSEEADPAIKAFKEVSEPMMRGYQTIFGDGDKKERWYKKIFKELNLFRKDESVFNKAEAKVLKNIEGKPDGVSGSGGGGWLAGGAGGLALGAGKSLLRKVPILGALLGGIGAFSDVSGTEADESLTRSEKDKRNGKSIGGAAGSFGGMLVGANVGASIGALGGPIGIAIGGVVGGAAGIFFGDKAGEVVGEKMGEWTTQLREADIPGKIVGAWETTTEAIKSGWDGALKLMSSAWDKTKELGNASNDFVKDKTGVDVKAEVKNAYQDAVNFTADNIIPSLADLANKGSDKLKQGAKWVGKNTTIGKGVGYIKGLLHTEGKTRVYDKGDGSTETREGGTVAWRNNNPGNLKFEHAGSADKTVKSKRTKEQALLSAQKSYDGVVDLDQWGNAIFNTEDAGRDAKAKLLTKKHGDKTIEEMLPKYAVSDYSGKADTQAYAAGIHKLAASRGLDLKGKKISDLNPDEFNALMDGMKKVEGFKEGSVSIQKPETSVASINAMPSLNNLAAGPRNTFILDKLSTTEASLNNLAAGPRNTPQTAYAAAPKVPTFSPVSAPAEAPPIKQYLASNSDRNTDASAPSIDVGQDIKERNIARIATGGFSGRG